MFHLKRRGRTLKHNIPISITKCHARMLGMDTEIKHAPKLIIKKLRSMYVENIMNIENIMT